MGCNCKSGKAQVLNNLKSKDHQRLAFDVQQRLINQKNQDDLTDLDWLEIFGVYYQLYPNSSAQPSKEDAIAKINYAAAML